MYEDCQGENSVSGYRTGLLVADDGWRLVWVRGVVYERTGKPCLLSISLAVNGIMQASKYSIHGHLAKN